MKKLLLILLCLSLLFSLTACYSEQDIENSYNKGYDKGKSAGYDEGYYDGYDAAYYDGYDDGNSSSYDDGFLAGYDEGYDDGHSDGYDDGYEAGQAAAKSTASKESSTASYSFGSNATVPVTGGTSPASGGAIPASGGTDYVLNTSTYKFHKPSCSSVDQMKESNKWYYTGTREEVINMGYDPCKRCNP